MIIEVSKVANEDHAEKVEALKRFFCEEYNTNVFDEFSLRQQKFYESIDPLVGVIIIEHVENIRFVKSFFDSKTIKAGRGQLTIERPVLVLIKDF